MIKGIVRWIRKIQRKILGGIIREILSELRWIYVYGLKYKGSVLWYLFLGALGTVTGLSSGVISKYIIDAVTGFDAQGLLPAAITYVLLQLFTIGSRAWSGIISAKIEIKVNQEIRADIYDKIMDADWEALSQFHSGDLLNRVDNDVSSVSSSVIGWVPDFVTRVFQFMGTLGVMIYFDVTLAILALLSAPVTLVVGSVVSRRIRNYSKKIKQISSEVMVFNEESFQNIQLIKSFGLTSFYKARLREVQEKYKKIRLDFNRFSILTNSGLSLVGSVVGMMCFGWGIYRLWTGHITYGTMTLFLQLASSLAGTFSSLVYMMPSAITAATAAGRLMLVTELPKEKRFCEEMVQEWMREKSAIEVSAENISFQYNTGKKVLEHADFVAKSGEIVALVGPSGEGKTTMLRILLGLVYAWEGTVTLKAVGKENEIPVSAATRPFFSYVPQDNVMFAGSIAENLRIMKQDATDDELNEALKKACAYEFVHRIPTGLNSPIGENGGGFSEGQIQRLAIARALLADAPVLVLDEATSALDVATERRILRNILEKSTDKTCIITTHRPSVLGMCDRIYRISNRKMEILQEADVEKMMMDF